MFYFLHIKYPNVIYISLSLSLSLSVCVCVCVCACVKHANQPSSDLTRILTAATIISNIALYPSLI